MPLQKNRFETVIQELFLRKWRLYMCLQATVYFLQATAAKALLGFTELKIGGNPINVTQIPVNTILFLPYLALSLPHKMSRRYKALQLFVHVSYVLCL